MHYFAKLSVGGLYLLKGTRYERGVEHAVSEELASYLRTLTDKRVVDQGDKKVIISVPLFVVREEAPTIEEKVLEEIKDAPDSLKPKRRKEPE